MPAQLLQRLAQASSLLLDWMLPRVCAGCADPLPAATACSPGPSSGSSAAFPNLRGLGLGFGPSAGTGGGPAPLRGWCPGCAASLPGLDAVRCQVCGERMPALAPGGAPVRSATNAAQTCGRCRRRPPAFDRTLVLADYAMPLDRLVQAIKFGRQSALAAPLGELLARAALTEARSDDAFLPDEVTAVPLVAARLAGRGFNQALLLARPVARAFGRKPAPHLLRRIHSGAPASSLGAVERRGALAHAFVGVRLSGSPTVLVVDDVMTTGATLHAAATALKAAGAGRVINCVAARTPSPRQGVRKPLPGYSSG